MKTLILVMYEIFSNVIPFSTVTVGLPCIHIWNTNLKIFENFADKRSTLTLPASSGYPRKVASCIMTNGSNGVSGSGQYVTSRHSY